MQRRSARNGRTAATRSTAVGVVLVGVLLAGLTACGSRVDKVATGATVPVTAGTGTTEPGSVTSGGTGGTNDGTKVGTIDNPCSATKASGATPSSPGVTADTIRIGVISDKKNPLTPVPTIGIEESMQAFVDFCNGSGGINGRKLELKTYDSEITKVVDVTKTACNDNLFALVGDGSVFDQQGIDVREKCGLPEVAAYSATPERSSSKDFFQGVPGTLPTVFNNGPCKYITKQYPAAAKKAAVVYVDIGASAARAHAIEDACTQAGMKFVASIGVDFGTKDYKPVVATMKSAGVRYLTVVGVVPETAALLREMGKQGFKVDVIDLGQQYYDPAMAAEPAADGALVLTNTAPFAEASTTPAMQIYETWLKKTGADPTSLGVQAFSAGLLFSTAAKSVGNDLTREALVAALHKIHSWDGGGLQMTTDPGRNAHNPCFLYLEIKDKEFVRHYPAKGFSCNASNVVKLDKPHTAAKP